MLKMGTGALMVASLLAFLHELWMAPKIVHETVFRATSLLVAMLMVGWERLTSSLSIVKWPVLLLCSFMYSLTLLLYAYNMNDSSDSAHALFIIWVRIN
jgi:hypothetical protein